MSGPTSSSVREQIQAWVAPLADTHLAVSLNEPASEAAIRDAEQELGEPIPQDLRELLSATDGATGHYGTEELWPLARIVQDNVTFRTSPVFAELYMPFEGLLFFADAGNGDQFFVSTRDTNISVMVWDHETDERRIVAMGVLDFVEKHLTGHLAI